MGVLDGSYGEPLRRRCEVRLRNGPLTASYGANAHCHPHAPPHPFTKRRPYQRLVRVQHNALPLTLSPHFSPQFSFSPRLLGYNAVAVPVAAAITVTIAPTKLQ